MKKGVRDGVKRPVNWFVKEGVHCDVKRSVRGA